MSKRYKIILICTILVTLAGIPNVSNISSNSRLDRDTASDQPNTVAGSESQSKETQAAPQRNLRLETQEVGSPRLVEASFPTQSTDAEDVLRSVILRSAPFELSAQVFASSMFRFNPFPEHDYQIIPTRTAVNSSANNTGSDYLHGQIVDETGAYLGTASLIRVLTSEGYGFSGTFALDSGVTFNLRHDQDGQTIIEEINENKLPGCGSDAMEHDAKGSVSNAQEAEIAEVKQLASASLGQNVSVKTSNSGTNLIPINLLIIYTPQARIGAGGLAAIEARARESVAVANQDYLNSKVNIQLNLIHLAEVSYNESANFAVNLVRLTTNGDNYLDEVHALRNQYQADMVAMLVDSMQYCGLGWLGGPYAWADNYMFSVTNQYCAPFHTLAHELGHNMGANHDPAYAGGQGAYSYSYGYRFGGGYYRTVMAYPPGVRVGYFSNPNVSYAGFPTGVANQFDNSRTLNNTAPIISGFRGGDYTVTGTVTVEGVALPGVVVSAGGLGTKVTGSNGGYSFDFAEGTQYTIQVALPGFTFTPASAAGIVAGNVNHNFDAHANPVLAAIPNIVVATEDAPLAITLSVSDLDSSLGELDFEATAKVYSREYALKERLQLVSLYRPSNNNMKKLGVFFRSRTGLLYYLKSNGKLYEYRGLNRNGRYVTTLPSAIYRNPSRLISAASGAALEEVDLNIFGNTLTLNPNGILGTFVVTVTVTDGYSSSSRSFRVTVN